ncbi:NAD(P)/FAD-dependent oxidoreductase [Undibacterium cyanobacteriorum]|uniref:NAD(P)/FAD-dependent oxidoreductase n=1 Tax=Undibacterium cyanobacteriorum TaxID=3073561 RepID=A0ABY9RFL0_9BURK|nr:NAD(P)/FAD-dependent oxidoreductase [Undibacterium sp. 20NA77.5]WMW79434.1 NAD(P)/FAD-dependent oxidoreductase [Undibacterium sp. 20NA77.5]
MKTILIAGAGIAGLASAIHLHRQGHQVTVYEHVADPTPVGAGILLQPSGQAQLARLGLLEQVESLAARVQSLQGYSGTWCTLDLHYQDVDPTWYGLGVHRANLHAVLWNAARELGITIYTGTAIESFQQDAQAVIVDVKHGTHSEFLRADALVIANGTRSHLRELLPIVQSYRPYPWGAFWSVLDVEQWDFPDILMQHYRGAAIMAGMLPTGRNPGTGKTCYSLFWSLPRAQFSLYQEQGWPGLIRRIEQVWPEVAQILAQQHPAISSDAVSYQALGKSIAIAEYADVRLKAYHHQRVVVLGDAAHAMSPQLGQGANMALIDAAVLAECLGAHGDVVSAFEQFTARRRRHMAYYQMASKWMTPLYQSHYPIGFMRDLGTSLGRRIPFLYKQYLLTLCGAKQGLFDWQAKQDAL